MADKKVVEKLRSQALELRKDLVTLCNKVPMHIGGDLSSADFMTAIWQYAMRYDPENPKWAERDRYVLSKGHAAAVTSFSQAMLGCYEKQEIYDEYATDFGRFGMHSCNLRNQFVEVSTGSLGHGLPISVGIAMALRVKKNRISRVYVVMGDGELNEGTIWEGAMCAAHHKLGNLVAFVDRNGLQIDGFTEDVMSTEPLADKWKSFGWKVMTIDGNNMYEIVDAIDQLPSPTSRKPTVIICKTVKGKNVDFMENEKGWHLGQISDQDFKRAIESLNAAYERGE
jgi:transketolase